MMTDEDEDILDPISFNLPFGAEDYWNAMRLLSDMNAPQNYEEKLLLLAKRIKLSLDSFAHKSFTVEEIQDIISKEFSCEIDDELYKIVIGLVAKICMYVL